MELTSLGTGLMIGIMALCLFAMLFVSSKAFLHKVHLHNLTVEARTLRNEYQRRLDALRSGRFEAVELLPGMDQGDETPMIVDPIESVEPIDGAGPGGAPVAKAA